MKRRKSEPVRAAASDSNDGSGTDFSSKLPAKRMKTTPSAFIRLAADAMRLTPAEWMYSSEGRMSGLFSFQKKEGL
jgi:hypothetical protein